MPLDQGVMDSQANASFQAQSAGHVQAANAALHNANQFQQSMNSVFVALGMALVKQVGETQVGEAIAETASGQQALKGANTTPPQTGQG